MDIIKLMISVIFMCFSLKSQVSFGANTISANQSLSGDRTIISANGLFVLGFFMPSSGLPSNNYIGIGYNRLSDPSIVWVANRQKPVSDRSASSLRISDGNLVLFDESQTPIWSTNLTSTVTRSIEAVLLDTGNLVLRDLSNNLSEPLWQSFDHPAHTWIPGMKLRFNKRTNVSQRITSWKNVEDPAPGLYWLELAPDGSNQFLILWNRTQEYWTSGPWNEDQKIFSLVPEMHLNYLYNFTYVSNENESYLTFTVKDVATSRFVIDVTGQLKQMNWLVNSQAWVLYWSQPRYQCEVYTYCGQLSSCEERQAGTFCSCLQGFQIKSENDWNLADYSGGCVRKTQLQCQNNSLANGESDRFLEYSNMALPKRPQSVAVENIKECATACLNNCSCSAYSYEDNACSIWIENFTGLQQLSQGGNTFYLKLAASELPSHPKNNKGRVIGGAVGSLALVVLFIGLIMLVYLRRRNRTLKTVRVTRGKVTNQVRLYDNERRVKEMVNTGQFKEEEREGIDLPFFNFESILAATDNFSEANKVGKGGFGPVYKGKFSEGQEIAVKRLSSVSGQGLEEFKNEVVLIARLQHRNLVRLLGYCIEGSEKILLYKYMPNKSLDFLIFEHEMKNFSDRKLSVLLDWNMRSNIILGIARGLLYLHQDSRLRIIHRDLKTSNILLDQEMNPKISDFGLARIFDGKQTEGTTNRVVGTYGYMSPEYALDGFFSVKSDVFSFGVVVLEIISGKRNTGFYNSEEALSLLGYAWRLWQNNRALDIMDEKVRESSKTNEILKCINVGLLCVQEDPNDRPTMFNIVIMLSSDALALPAPKRPAFVVRRGPSSIATTFSSSKPEINAELIITLEAR